MTHPNTPTSGHVVIAGGGVAGLEALLALRAFAGDHLDLTLVAPQDWFVDRPMTVAHPFGLGPVARYSLPELAAESGAEFVRATVTAVHAAEQRISCADGRDVPFDTLILAPGAQQRSPFPDAIAFGVEGSDQAISEMLRRLRTGEARSAAFVAPSMKGWLLPLYELALMTARELARSEVEGVRLSVLSPEFQPLALFGDEASQGVAQLLAMAKIEFIGPTSEPAAADYVVTLPLLSGPGLAGVPAMPPDEFIPVDPHGRVTGLENVYAAGDAVDFPIKQGGLAAQQADAVAEHVAARYGAHVEPAPFLPVLRGMLFTGDDPLYMRFGVPGADPDVPDAWYPLWWPPTKVAGRYLAPYLFGQSDDGGFGSPPVGFIDVDIPLSAMTLPG